jgi:serine/threonine protein phosphatase PrpC
MGRWSIWWGVAHDQGPRPSDEDAWCVLPGLDGREGTLWAGVFDGHGGAEAARLAAPHLPRLFREAWQASSGAWEERVRMAFTRAYTEASLLIGRQTSSGTTAATVWVTPEGIGYAHVGDSRIVLAQGGEVKRLTRDHKVSDRQEYARLVARGARFWGPYIVLPGGKGLAVARALGDRAFSPFVIPDPDVGFLPPLAGERTLILACDGLWDVVEDDEAAGIATGEEDVQRAAQALVEEALARGTTDNVTVVVVRVRGG